MDLIATLIATLITTLITTPRNNNMALRLGNIVLGGELLNTDHYSVHGYLHRNVLLPEPLRPSTPILASG